LAAELMMLPTQLFTPSTLNKKSLFAFYFKGFMENHDVKINKVLLHEEA
jgi:hypothetical protein